MHDAEDVITVMDAARMAKRGARVDHVPVSAWTWMFGNE
jgi:hypothetical protein